MVGLMNRARRRLQSSDRSQRYGLHGYWSRRIGQEHRLVYKVVDEEIRVAGCRFQYDD
jgi:Txe/YoeB family toxin of toxin-antitoxin system